LRGFFRERGGGSKVNSLALFNLSGKVAIVTGGCQGIGFAIAEGLASAGATTVIADILAEQAGPREPSPSSSTVGSRL
jgi:hypothetical protein